jgi:hypothetical protein
MWQSGSGKLCKSDDEYVSVMARDKNNSKTHQSMPPIREFKLMMT